MNRIVKSMLLNVLLLLPPFYSQAQDTVFFKINKEKAWIFKSVRISDGIAYLVSLENGKETSVAEKDIYRIGFYSNSLLLNQELRTEQYCILVGNSTIFSTKVKISIDFGEELEFWANQNYLKDQTGKAIKFNSMVDALNYMNGLGWEFVSAYPMKSEQGNCYHYLMKKKILKNN